MSAHRLWALVRAAAAAILIQPCLFSIWMVVSWMVVLSASPAREAGPLPDAAQLLTWLLFFLVCVLAVATAFVLLLGVPLFLVLLRLRRTGVLAMGISGFLAGAMPLALLTWPSRFPDYSSSGNWNGRLVDFCINGVPTVYGWLSYCAGVMQFGLHGLAGALVFLWIWRRRTQGLLGSASQSSHSRPSW